jgi:predicted MFS family arabinose efflux permease
MMAAFLWTARRKGDDALIDLRLFKGRVFSTAAITQFLSNGGMFAGQMLIPAFLIEACGRTPGEMGWMLAPLGIGMMITNPFMGVLTDRFGIRRVSAGGALLTFIATLPMVFLATQGLNFLVLIPALLLRGMGMSGVGLPSLTAAYASVSRQKMPMATTSLNIVQRLGGPTMTTLCATFLAWKLGPHSTDHAVSSAYAWTFLMLCGLHAFTFLGAIQLPRRLDEVAGPE